MCYEQSTQLLTEPSKWKGLPDYLVLSDAFKVRNFTRKNAESLLRTWKIGLPASFQFWFGYPWLSMVFFFWPIINMQCNGLSYRKIFLCSFISKISFKRTRTFCDLKRWWDSIIFFRSIFFMGSLAAVGTFLFELEKWTTYDCLPDNSKAPQECPPSHFLRHYRLGI